jgi:hypothetical protein
MKDDLRAVRAKTGPSLSLSPGQITGVEKQTAANRPPFVFLE